MLLLNGTHTQVYALQLNTGCARNRARAWIRSAQMHVFVVWSLVVVVVPLGVRCQFTLAPPSLSISKCARTSTHTCHIARRTTTAHNTTDTPPVPDECGMPTVLCSQACWTNTALALASVIHKADVCRCSHSITSGTSFASIEVTHRKHRALRAHCPSATNTWTVQHAI